MDAPGLLYRGEDLGGNGGLFPSKFQVEGRELPISPKTSDIFNKI